MAGIFPCLSVTGWPMYLTNMDSYPKVPFTPFGKCNPLYIYDDGQWDESDGDAIFGANIYATSYTQSVDVLDSTLSVPKKIPPESPSQMILTSPRVILT